MRSWRGWRTNRHLAFKMSSMPCRLLNFPITDLKHLTAVHVRGLQEKTAARSLGRRMKGRGNGKRRKEVCGGERWRWTLEGFFFEKRPRFMVGLLAILQTESWFLSAGAQWDVEMADTRLCISTSASLKRWTNLSFLHKHLFLINKMKQIKRCKQPDTANRRWSSPISISCTVAMSSQSPTLLQLL